MQCEGNQKPRTTIRATFISSIHVLSSAGPHAELSREAFNVASRLSANPLFSPTHATQEPPTPVRPAIARPATAGARVQGGGPGGAKEVAAVMLSKLREPLPSWPPHAAAPLNGTPPPPSMTVV